MSKTHMSLEEDFFLSDADFEHEFRETHVEKRDKHRRQTEVRRKMEDKIERRRMAEELGMYLEDSIFSQDARP